MSSLFQRPNNLLGIAMMLIGFFVFAANDALGKWLLATATVGQLMLARGVVGLMVVGSTLAPSGLAPVRAQKRIWLQIVRGMLSATESSLFFVALIFLPLASVMTYYLAGPIYVTALSPWLLGEQVGWRRWLAVGIGFCGVIIAIQPGTDSLSWGAIAALAGSIAYAFVMVFTRKLAATDGRVLMGWQLVSAIVVGIGLTAYQGFAPLGTLDIVLIGILAIGSLAGNWCVNISLQLAPASVVVPYQYSLIIWGVLFGYLVFGEVSESHTLIGAAIIIAAGLFIFLREQRLHRGATSGSPSVNN
ncbi:MAG: DMT family transporter [Proteobacteria bacterium]|nr:DMT family transporter [Pseudomonadota bacterium]